MATRKLKRNADRWWAISNAAINASATSLVLASSGAAGLTAPCLIHREGATEKILVTAIATDTPSSGLDTLTIERGYGGTTAVSHGSGTKFLQFIYRETLNEMATQLEAAKMLIACVVGRGTGIQRSAAKTELMPKAQDTPDMTIKVQIGAAIIDDEPAALLDEATLTFTAPSTNPRIDALQMDTDGVVTAVTGTEDASPTAPAVSSGSLKLGEVYHTTAETSIKDADDATNGYITTTGRTYL